MISAENTNYNLRFSDIADEEIEQAIEYHSLKSENGEYNFKSHIYKTKASVLIVKLGRPYH